MRRFLTASGLLLASIASAAEYPRELRTGLISACMNGNENAVLVCECMTTKLEQRYDLSALLELDEQSTKVAFTKAVVECRLEVAKRVLDAFK
jgi:hypothetical protein